MFYYRYFCFQCFFRAEKALYMGKPDFFGNCFAFFCSGGSDCRPCRFVESRIFLLFILRIFIPIYLSSRKKSFFVRCEIQVSVLFLCSPVLCPGLLWSYWKHYAHIFDLTKFLFRFSFSVSLSPWTRFFIWF